jgi:hypothetical protein
VAIAHFVYMLTAAVVIRVLLRPSAAGPSIGASGGGVWHWPLLVTIGLIGGGMLAAAVGLVRGEHPRWVHGVGIVLALAMPVSALRILNLFLR